MTETTQQRLAVVDVRQHIRCEQIWEWLGMRIGRLLF